jgi:hypothetical protein
MAIYLDCGIRYRTEEPDYSALTKQIFSWVRSVYGNVKELLPCDAPPPKGKPVVLSSYVDANLLHDQLTGRSVTAVLHFINKTPNECCSKRQTTVETATYGSEFTAARIAVYQIIENRITLCYLGVPVDKKSY